MHMHRMQSLTLEVLLIKFWHGANVGNYKWDEKKVETGTATDQTFTMSGDKYEYKSSESSAKLESPILRQTPHSPSLPEATHIP